MKRRGNILVIDDEAPILDSLRLNLAHSGYSISTAKSGEEGVALFDGGDFDLVLCDLQLPDMSGTDVLKKLKEKRPSVEVIIISGYGSVANAVEATKAGAFHFVEKPFEFDALNLLIERALERQTLIEESDSLRRTLQQRTTYSDIVG
ncbi:MAG TPA: response regulator, partial [Blastocatellia bacterium]|nr:response regulator [Blastocatellia bacterium]